MTTTTRREALRRRDPRRKAAHLARIEARYARTRTEAPSRI